MIEGVGDAVVKGGQTFSVDAGADDRHVGFGKATREVLVEDVKSSRRGMVEAGKTVELAYSILDVHSQLLVVRTISVELAHSGCQGLQAAVEWRAVDDIDGGIQLGDVLGQFL